MDPVNTILGGRKVKKSKCCDYPLTELRDVGYDRRVRLCTNCSQPQ